MKTKENDDSYSLNPRRRDTTQLQLADTLARAPNPIMHHPDATPQWLAVKERNQGERGGERGGGGSGACSVCVLDRRYVSRLSNPVGRVWRQNESMARKEVCKRGCILYFFFFLRRCPRERERGRGTDEGKGTTKEDREGDLAEICNKGKAIYHGLTQGTPREHWATRRWMLND